MFAIELKIINEKKDDNFCVCRTLLKQCKLLHNILFSDISCFVTPQKHRFPKGNTRFYLVLYEIHVYFGDTFIR